MKIAKHVIWAVFIGLFIFGYSIAQNAGDYRSAQKGVWSAASTWETFDGADWVAAGDIPTGAETITVDGTDSVWVDIPFTITGSVVVVDTGVVEVTDGSLEFANGSTYEHARDAGSIPLATWSEGSLLLLTGTVQDAPGNRNQDFYNVTFNTPDLGRNRDMGWKGKTIIGGDVHVISTGANRWQMSSVSANDTAEFSIMGDVIVEAGTFAVQGTGNALTTFIVHHYGDIEVTGGNFSIARGSQGSGSGTTTWNLYEGDFTMSNAATQNSNPTAGNAKFVFASPDSQYLSFTNVDYAGGDIHFKVADSTKLKIDGDFSANGLFINEGEIEPLGTLTFLDGAVYEHAQNGGDMPDIIWNTGSTALFTGITSSAPGNRGQDYYHLTLNTPNLSSNRDLDMDGHTISGDVTVISTGTNRWQLVGGSSGTVTIMGDVIVQDGQFTTQGTSSLTNVIVDHYGDVVVTGGNFSVSRGSQGSGVGSTRWYLHKGSFSMSNATTQNSNSKNAWFVFAGDTLHNITLDNVSYGGGGLAMEIDSGATLDFGSSELGGNGLFIMDAGATLATAHADGLEGTLQSTGKDSISIEANFTFNRSEDMQAAKGLPDSVGVLTVTNPGGVTPNNVVFNDTLFCAELIVSANAIMEIDTAGHITTLTGQVYGAVSNKGVLEAAGSIAFEDEAVYSHARNGGSIPNGAWNEGSTLFLSGITDSAPGNRNQNYYNIMINTPDLASNLDLSLKGVTIGGDITITNTGSQRWRLTSASAGDTAIVTIMGDMNVEGGSFETQGTSNALTVFEVHHYGDVNVTGGTFAVSRGSQGDGSGSTRWFMHEGNFSIANAQTRNSNPTNAWFVFDKDTLQTITLTNVSYGGGGLPVQVADGAMLDFCLSEVEGNGLFVLDGGATILTANPGGIDSTLKTEGDITLSKEAGFVFNGSSAQVTNLMMPDTVNGLTIDNEAGVVLSKETVINGVLRLVAGVFDNTIPFTLGPNGSISYEGGSLLHPVSIDNQIPEMPNEFALFQNYPNPFNPSTTIRYDVAKQAQVIITIYDLMGQKVTELVNNQRSPGKYSIVWNAAGYASGIYYYRIQAGDFISVKKLIMMK